MKKLYINENNKLGKINAEIYGQFAEHLGRCIYDGVFVGENSEIPHVNGMRKDVVDALKEMKVPVLRWPGGCFADEYHWRDGIGPKETRKKMINTNWGGTVEDNSFGTHEFFELCEQLGCKTYVNANLGSGTVQEMSEWVEYMTSNAQSPVVEERRKNGRQEPWKVDYLGIGNESWGCGGHMPPAHYGGEFRRYNTFVKHYDFNPANRITRIASGPNGEDYNWTEVVMDTILNDKGFAPEYEWYQDMVGTRMGGLALHYYTYPDGHDNKQLATDFNKDGWYRTMHDAAFIEELIQKHGTIMDKYDPNKNVGLMIDEWGTWFACEPGTNPFFLYQQNTMRDALVAGLSLNIFNKHNDRVKMTNIAQMVNVLQSMILTEGPKMILTPTYHVFKMYKNHQDATLLHSHVEGINKVTVNGSNQVADLFESVSINEEGKITATINNTSYDQATDVEIIFAELKPQEITASILVGEPHAHNTFDNPEVVKTEHFNDYQVTDRSIKFNLPASSVITLEVK